MIQKMNRDLLLRWFYSISWRVNTRYSGEFGYELISVLPFAYWLKQKGKLGKSISSKDTKCFYFFSKNHIEKYQERDFVIPRVFPINDIHVSNLSTTMWSPPPLKSHYMNDEFIFDKPILIICNKFNSEWGGSPVTFFDLDCLKILFDRFHNQYQIIYFRPEGSDIVTDNSQVYRLDEYDYIRTHYKSVILIQDLVKEYPQYTFNEVQLKCFANSNRFITTQGGYAILASYFKGINVIYGACSKDGRMADEIKLNAFENWYPLFSGSTIFYSPTYEDLYKYTAVHF
tara:strand:+ start:2774 stop:3631 length:858 start_codon:yes stop_codon:yes gene_type:complete